MKYFVKFFVVTLFLLICTHLSAEQKVLYIDMKFILNNSKAGKGAQDFLQKTFKENQERFSNEEKNLKKEEEDLLANKTNFDKAEYKQKADQLRKNVINYQSQRRISLEKLTNQRKKARDQLLEKLNPILNNYIKENNVSLVLDKKDVLGGQTELDITNIIVEKLNKELPALNLE